MPRWGELKSDNNAERTALERRRRTAAGAV